MHFHILGIDKSPKYVSVWDRLTCQCSDQWFRKLELLYSVSVLRL